MNIVLHHELLTIFNESTCHKLHSESIQQHLEEMIL